jgi:hypothetical protein
MFASHAFYRYIMTFATAGTTPHEDKSIETETVFCVCAGHDDNDPGEADWRWRLGYVPPEQGLNIDYNMTSEKT